MNKEDLGLAVLTVASAMGVWCTFNSPLYMADISTNTPVKLKAAKLNMLIGLATTTALAGGIYAVYGKKGTCAAIASGLTGIVLYQLYSWKLKKMPGKTRGIGRFEGIKQVAQRLPEGLKVPIAGQ